MTPHFSVAELVTTSHPQMQNPPDDDALRNAFALAVGVLEPLRALLGVPLRVTSWYRSTTLNAFVGGVDRSLHLRGAAVDVVPIGIDRLEAWAALLEVGVSLPITTAIVYEDMPHLHLSYAWWRGQAPTARYVVTARDKLILWSRYRGKLKRA